MQTLQNRYVSLWLELDTGPQRICCSFATVPEEEEDDDDYNRDSLERELEKPIYDPFKEYL